MDHQETDGHGPIEGLKGSLSLSDSNKTEDALALPAIG